MRPYPSSRSLRALAATTICVTAVTGAAGFASAAKPTGAGTVHDIAPGLAGPLQIDVGPSGTVYVAQNFAGLLSVIDRTGEVSAPLAVNSTGEIGGVAVRGNTIAYTTNDRDPATFEATASTLVALQNGLPALTVDLLAYEQTNNPDQDNTYGFASISEECAAQVPPDFGPPTYTGGIDTHPYALANASDGWYVAEAGGNAILHVSSAGSVSTVAVLPPQPVTLTDAATGVGFPECAIGLEYSFEPVATDVEVGDDGFLYVTTLPGGPENPALGARGSLYKVNPADGSSQRIATGFAGAVNVAVGGGKVYVSELFADTVSVITPEGTSTIATLPNPAALEWAQGKLFVGYNAFGNGTVATIDLR